MSCSEPDLLVGDSDFSEGESGCLETDDGPDIVGR